jgi:hypothetical protein
LDKAQEELGRSIWALQKQGKQSLVEINLAQDLEVVVESDIQLPSITATI